MSGRLRFRRCGILTRRGIIGRRLVFLILIHDVLHDNGNAPVSRIERSIWFAKPLIGEAADLDNLIGMNAVRLHNSARRIGAVGRESQFPYVAEGA